MKGEINLCWWEAKESRARGEEAILCCNSCVKSERQVIYSAMALTSFIRSAIRLYPNVWFEAKGKYTYCGVEHFPCERRMTQ